MDVKEIHDQKELDKFVASQPRSQFLQSWAWGAFKEREQFGVKRFGLYDDATLIGTASVLQVTMPARKIYWYIPRGPILKFNLPAENCIPALSFFLTALNEEAVQAGAIFVRMEPSFEKGDIESFPKIMKDFSLTRTKSIQPSDTSILDLGYSPEELLSHMHQKTRYNIRLAQKKGVKIRKGSADEIKHFNQLNKETTERDQFQSHESDYYEQMFQNLPEDFIHLYLAEFEGKVIAANIVISFGDMYTYIHGASANQSRNVMAPHLLQWQQILDAKEAGKGWYDFWGVAPHTADDEHSWAGITRFKRGFNGTDVMYIGTFDAPLRKWWYRMYSTARR